MNRKNNAKEVDGLQESGMSVIREAAADENNKANNQQSLLLSNTAKIGTETNL